MFSTRGSGRRASASGVALILALVCAACTPAESPPHILLITLDTTRRDHCSVYGYTRGTTPNLQRVAAEGVLFDLAYAPAATTGPTHATIFTGLYPITHRVVKNGRLLGSGQLTLAERLRERGYATAGLVSSFVLDEKFGYGQGFELYDDEFDRAGASLRVDRWEGLRVENGFDRRGDETTRLALDWLEGQRDSERPFFLFVHYFDPHDPYSPPPQLAGRFPTGADADELEVQIARYDAEIAFADQQIGELLDALDRHGLAEQTLVVIAGDHGEGLMQHGHMAHGVHIYEEQVRVPLLLRWPDRLEAGRVVERAVQLVDLAPTLLELAGRAAPEGSWQGHSLVPLLDGSAASDAGHPVYLHRRRYEPGIIGTIRVHGEKFGVRLGDWKYILGPEEQTRELFDLAGDPGERRNLHDERPERASELARRLAVWRSEAARPDPQDSEISAEDQERLRSLGYVN